MGTSRVTLETAVWRIRMETMQDVDGRELGRATIAMPDCLPEPTAFP